MKHTLTIIAALLISISTSAQDWANFGKYAQANSEVTESPVAVFMGDSITEGWANQDPGFFTENNFLGRGISGQTSSHMLVRFRRDVIDHSPKYVVILAGTNDIALNNGKISLENILGNIISMCELARCNDIKPIICSVLPAAKFPWRPEVTGSAEDVVKLNEMLKEYAESEQITYVDYHSVLRDENNGLPKQHAGDGIHPNLDCYKIMEKIIMEAL